MLHTLPYPLFTPNRLAAAVALATSLPVFAQTTLSTVEVSAHRNAASLHLDQATPTGSRTGITARELPAAVSTVDALQMQERGDFQIREGITRATGITDIGSGGTGGLSFSARGYTGTNSVGIAEDGIRIQTGAGTQNYPGSAWGYERVEVLHGPASVVFGSGTVGATINAIRKEPSRTASQEAMAAVGTDGVKRLGVGATGGLGEIASYRIDAYGTDIDGYRDLGQSREAKLMSRLRLQPSSDLRVDLTADYSVNRPERYWGTPHDNGRILPELRRENYNADDAVIRYADTRLRARVEWQVNDRLSLSNELYHLESKRRWMNIESYTLNTAAHRVDRSDYLHIQHELAQTGNRLEASLKHGSHRAVLGWEAARVSFRHINNAPYGGSSSVSIQNPAHGQWFSPDATLAKFDTASTLHGFYAEDAWQFDERWLLLAGFRHDRANIYRDELVSGTDFGRSLTGNAWRLGLTHFLTRDTSVYAQYATGHDPVTSMISLNLANADFKLTRGKLVEVGLKQKLGNGLGEWSAAFYRIDKDDIVTRDPNNSALSIQGGSQYSQGIELAAALTPSPNWRFEGNVTRLQAEYTHLIERVSGVGVSRAGNTPANVPTFVANLWGHYRLGAMQTSLGLRHVGKNYADNANSLQLGAYTVADASIAWQVDGKTTLRLLGRNLADKLYATRTYNNQMILGEARRFELVAEMKF
ncbi:TonB-dependent receptor [Dechloromonas sp. ZS-1]|uniref:TonB-dependent receptor n=1 Tax=Dechloromonas sp. ZS-1 TaxID=3138067 RepID=UPI0031FBCD76